MFFSPVSFRGPPGGCKWCMGWGLRVLKWRENAMLVFIFLFRMTERHIFARERICVNTAQRYRHYTQHPLLPLQSKTGPDVFVLMSDAKWTWSLFGWKILNSYAAFVWAHSRQSNRGRWWVTEPERATNATWRSPFRAVLTLHSMFFSVLCTQSHDAARLLRFQVWNLTYPSLKASIQSVFSWSNQCLLAVTEAGSECCVLHWKITEDQEENAAVSFKQWLLLLKRSQ